MQVKNINELKQDFPLTYFGETHILKYGLIYEVPEGVVPMEGIRGWLICRPTPAPPSLIEIDLDSLHIYEPEKYELTEEEQVKADEVIENSFKEMLERKEQSKREESGESNETKGFTTESEDNSGNNSGEGSTERIEEPINSDSIEVIQEDSDNVQEKVKPLAGKRIKRGIASRIEKDNEIPLKGFKIKRSIKKSRKDKKIEKIISEGKREYIEDIRKKVDEKLGIQ